MSNLHNRLALVTGATSGIGEAICVNLINAGMKVIGTGRNKDKLLQLKNQYSDRFLGIDGDIYDSDLQDRLFTEGTNHFGLPISLVVCNAGRGLGGPVSSADLSQFEEMIRVNLTATLKLMQKSAQYLLNQRESLVYPEQAMDIIVIGSIVGRHVSPFSAVYGSSKFAIHSLVEGLRREICAKGIRVTLIEPGFVLSGFQDVAGYSEAMVNGMKEKYGPLLMPEDIARSVNFIASQPPHVHVSDIIVRPTKQDYP